MYWTLVGADSFQKQAPDAAGNKAINAQNTFSDLNAAGQIKVTGGAKEFAVSTEANGMTTLTGKLAFSVGQLINYDSGFAKKLTNRDLSIADFNGNEKAFAQAWTSSWPILISILPKTARRSLNRYRPAKIQGPERVPVGRGQCRGFRGQRRCQGRREGNVHVPAGPRISNCPGLFTPRSSHSPAARKHTRGLRRGRPSRRSRWCTVFISMRREKCRVRISGARNDGR